MSDVMKNLNNFAQNNNISQDSINNLLNMLNNSNSDNKDSSDNSSKEQNNSSANANNIDFETIMKMKNIIDKMNNKDDPRSILLQSLKPYLNENRKGKVDQYIQLMNMSKVFDVFSSFGGDKNNVK
jgi:hypothetical protein